MKCVTITLCEICQTPVKGPGISKPVNGMCLTLGYSRGGWGRRESFINWTGEVCDKCFYEYSKIAEATRLWMEKRDGSRAPEIVVTEHDVSTVPANEPSSRGRQASLLR